MTYWKKRRLMVVAVVGVLTVFGAIWAESGSLAQTPAGPPAPGAAAPSAPPTGNQYADFTGRTEAVQTIEVRPSMPGLLTTVAFREGQEVRQGDLLFEFDPRPQQAAVELARAEVEQAQAELAVAQADAARLKQLVAAAAVSREDVDKAAAHMAVATAALQAAKAKLQTAQLNLESTRIISPITGRIGRAYLSAGNWVEPGTLLTTIVSQDPIHVYFDIDEKQYLQLARQWRQDGGSVPAKPPRLAVKVGLGDEEGFPRDGVVDFIDTRLDPKTGTIRFRAVLPNADRLMIPGLFVRVRMPLETARKP